MYAVAVSRRGRNGVFVLRQVLLDGSLDRWHAGCEPCVRLGWLHVSKL